MARRSTAKKELYNVFNKGIKNYAKASPKEFVKEVARMSKQLNQRFYRLEKKGIENKSDAYKFAIVETEKDKPRYSVNIKKLSKLSYDELYDLAVEIGYKLASPTSTIRGIDKVTANRIQGSLRAINDVTGVEIDPSDWQEFLESGGGQLMNSKYLDSNQIAEDFHRITQSGNVSTKEFIKEFNRFKVIKKEKTLDSDTADRLAKDFSYDRVTRNLDNLLKRKSQPKEQRKRRKK